MNITLHVHLFPVRECEDEIVREGNSAIATNASHRRLILVPQNVVWIRPVSFFFYCLALGSAEAIILIEIFPGRRTGTT